MAPHGPGNARNGLLDVWAALPMSIKLLIIHPSCLLELLAWTGLARMRGWELVQDPDAPMGGVYLIDRAKIQEIEDAILAKPAEWPR